MKKYLIPNLYVLPVDKKNNRMYNKGTKLRNEVITMKNFTIDAYIKQQLIFAETMPTDAELFEHNALGAIEWNGYVNGTDSELERRWNENYKPAFEKIIRGFFHG